MDQRTTLGMHFVAVGLIRWYRDWSIASRPKATNPRATAVSSNLPNGCARAVCSAPVRGPARRTRPRRSGGSSSPGSVGRPATVSRTAPDVTGLRRPGPAGRAAWYSSPDRGRRRSGRNGTVPPPEPGPCGHPLGPAPYSRRLSFHLPARPVQADRDSPPGYGPAEQSEFVLAPIAPPDPRSGPAGASNRPPVRTAASRHGEHDPPKRRAIPAANAPSISTTAASGSAVGAGRVNSTPNCARRLRQGRPGPAQRLFRSGAASPAPSKTAPQATPRPGGARPRQPWPATPLRSPSPRPRDAATHSPAAAPASARTPDTDPAAAATDPPHERPAPAPSPKSASRLRLLPPALGPPALSLHSGDRHTAVASP